MRPSSEKLISGPAHGKVRVRKCSHRTLRCIRAEKDHRVHVVLDFSPRNRGGVIGCRYSQENGHEHVDRVSAVAVEPHLQMRIRSTAALHHGASHFIDIPLTVRSVITRVRKAPLTRSSSTSSGLHTGVTGSIPQSGKTDGKRAVVPGIGSIDCSRHGNPNINVSYVQLDQGRNRINASAISGAPDSSCVHISVRRQHRSDSRTRARLPLCRIRPCHIGITNGRRAELANMALMAADKTWDRISGKPYLSVSLWKRGTKTGRANDRSCSSQWPADITDQNLLWRLRFVIKSKRSSKRVIGKIG